MRGLRTSRCVDISCDVVAVRFFCKAWATSYRKHGGDVAGRVDMRRMEEIDVKVSYEKIVDKVMHEISCDVVAVRFFCKAWATSYRKHGGDVAGRVDMRRMEEIDVKVSYDSWRGICTKKCAPSHKPPLETKRAYMSFIDSDMTSCHADATVRRYGI
ncbi:hypothetical protein Tco_0004316 [Tanacetum coccineum]